MVWHVVWYGGMVVRWYGGMAVWWYGGMVVWWYGGMVVWWYGGMACGVVWCGMVWHVVWITKDNEVAAERAERAPN